MIDFHCHLDLYPNPAEIVACCLKQKLYVLSVTTVPSAFEGTAALIPQDSRIRTALGLHPELAAARSRELPLFEKLLPRTRYVGEVGLDGSTAHRASIDRQTGALNDVLTMCARAGGRIISLHSRGAAKQILDVLSDQPAAGTFVLHWYSASKKQVERATELGCWFSVNPAMLNSETGRSAVAAMPRDKIVPESDGPFGTTEGTPNLPWQAWSIVTGLSDVWNTPIDDVERQLFTSFRSLVSDTTAN